jgi:hypothetical protein
MFKGFDESSKVTTSLGTQINRVSISKERGHVRNALIVCF